MERITTLLPAYDKRDSDPKKDYGIHGVELRMVLKGDKGAVQFVLFTNWHLPNVAKELETKSRILSKPMPADVGYHSLTPQYEGQMPMDDCAYLDGEPCYYDGSGLQAEETFKTLLSEGDEGVWKELERRYRSLFES